MPGTSPSAPQRGTTRAAAIRRPPPRPAPADAMSGTSTTAVTARSRSRSNPERVPSRSIDVRRISPAPSPAARRTQATASRPVASRPPRASTSQPPSADTARTSTATTTHCRPKTRAQRRMSPGSAMAAVFTATLSAPARSTARMPAVERTPPPTVRGTNSRRAVRTTSSSSVARPSRTPQVHEARALHDAAAGHVEAGDDATEQHRSGAREGHGVGEQAQPAAPATLRVELRAEQPARRDDAREAPPVLGLGEDHRRVVGDAHEGVDEVGGGSIGDALEEGVAAATLDGVPADVWQPRRADDGAHRAAEQAEQFRTVLLGALEEELQAEADAEVPGAVVERRADRVVEPAPAQPRHGRPAGADARGHDERHAGQAGGPAGDGGDGARRLEGGAPA